MSDYRAPERVTTDATEHEKHVATDGGATFICRDLGVDHMEHNDTGSQSVYKGRIAVEICIECLYTIVTCLHIKCSWNEHGTWLTCDLCGKDCT